MSKIRIVWYGLMLVAFGLDASDQFQFPILDHSDTYFGVEVPDPYQWLEDGNDPLVQKWEKEQNSVFEEYRQTSKTYQGIQTFYAKLKASDQIEVQFIGNEEKVLISFHDPDQHAPIYSIMENVDGESRLFLDVNLWPGECTIDYIEPSPDGSMVAFGIQKGGDELPCMLIMDTNSLQRLDESFIGHNHTECLWTPDSKALYYTANPSGDSYFNQKIYYHLIGSTQEKDRVEMEDLLYQDWFYSLWEQDGHIHLIRTRYSDQGTLTMEGHKKPFTNPKSPFKQYYDSNQDEYVYKTMNVGGVDYLLTNDHAELFRLVKMKSGKVVEVIPECEDLLLHVTGCNGKLAATYLQHGHHCVRIYDTYGKLQKKVPFPEFGTCYFEGCWSSPLANIYFTSLIRPDCTYEYEETNNKLTLETQNKIEGFNPDLYEVKQLFVTSTDGAQVPVHLAHRKGVTNRPALLTGYGGFACSMKPAFSYKFLPWLQSAGIVCVAHLRGGGVYGDKWHRQGMQGQKQRVFDDFIAVSEWLTETHTIPAQLAITGRSNGGLLVGACLLQRPDLYGAAVSGVPLLDMLRYHLFRMGSIWKGEYGSSDRQDQFRYLKEYSPYHNVVEGVNYPPTLITTCLNDRRVDPMHARKMSARLQYADPEAELHRFIAYPNSGHIYHSEIDSFRRIVDQNAFLMEHVGLSLKTRRAIPETFEERKKQFFENLKKNKYAIKDIRKKTNHINLKKKFKKQFNALH